MYKLFILILCAFCIVPSVANNHSNDSLIHVVENDSVIFASDSLEKNAIADSLMFINDTINDKKRIDSLIIINDSILLENDSLFLRIVQDSIVFANKLKEVEEKFLLSLNELKKRNEKLSYAKNDLLGDPYFFQIFASPTLFNAPLKRQIGELPVHIDDASNISTTPILNKILLSEIDNTLLHIYGNEPNLIKYDENQYAKDEGLRNDVAVEIKPQVKFSEKKAAEMAPNPNVAADDWDVVVRKPNFWTFQADFSLQFLQNYVTDNWYKGGDNSNSWKTEVNITANYNNKQKVLFENRLEMRLGFQSTQGDETHKYRSNSDLIRLTNKLGLQATKRWYYTVTLQSWTQFYPGYKKNDERVYSDFMSPFESLLTVGMDYKLNVKKFNLSASLSPFAGKFKYVDRKSLTSSFGLKNDKHSNLEYGSNITINYTWEICKNVSWRGRIYYFTDYDKSQIEWENTFNLKINKFLTTKLFVYPRFDDSVQRKDGDSYFQFNETLSIGFDYTF